MRRRIASSITAPSTPTASAASRTDVQKPRAPPPSAGPSHCVSEYAAYSPIMNIEPCAKLTIRVTPKISDRPTAIRNSVDAPASPLSSWTAKPETMRRGPRDSVGGAQLAGLLGARQHRGAVDVAVVL